MTDFEKQKIKEWREYFVEMHPMFGHDMHNPPLLYFSNSEKVNELKDFIKQALRQARLNALEEVEKNLPPIWHDSDTSRMNTYNYCLADIEDLLNKLYKLKP